MRVFLRVNEDRKKQLITVANKSASTTVIGSYYKGCSLVKYIYSNQTILSIK